MKLQKIIAKRSEVNFIFKKGNWKTRLKKIIENEKIPTLWLLRIELCQNMT